jgi:hypothetical protein
MDIAERDFPPTIQTLTLGSVFAGKASSFAAVGHYNGI